MSIDNINGIRGVTTKIQKENAYNYWLLSLSLNVCPGEGRFLSLFTDRRNVFNVSAFVPSSNYGLGP